MRRIAAVIGILLVLLGVRLYCESQKNFSQNTYKKIQTVENRSTIKKFKCFSEVKTNNENV